MCFILFLTNKVCLQKRNIKNKIVPIYCMAWQQFLNYMQKQHYEEH